MGEIFEDQIFCANVHKGNVKRAPSSPIVGPMQVLNVNKTRSFGCVLGKKFRQNSAYFGKHKNNSSKCGSTGN
jgi:hypothetical protein